MNIKKVNPCTPGQRNYIKVKNILAKKSLLKSLIKGRKNNAGKNNAGKITVFHKGGGHKKKYRNIDYNLNENKINIVCNIEYDPFRNTSISALYDYKEKKFSYILTPKNIKIGDIIKKGKYAELKTGHTLPLTKIPVGSLIHNISLNPKQKGICSRSAGTFSVLIEKGSKTCKLKLSSNKIITISINNFATLGIVSNEFSFLTTIGKAGRARWLNKRPTVRGVAMNPIDHPHGGGEGKKSGIRKTPWGKTI